MAETEMNADRERRIGTEIVVNAHGPEEQGMGETGPDGSSVAVEARGGSG